jgi:dipeptidyl aminopeptidase/acylaminoacyl peptidase
MLYAHHNGGRYLVATWREFSEQAPELAEKAVGLLERSGMDEILLATVRDDEPPRIHPVTVQIRDGGLYVFLHPSSKLTDLEIDGRYAVHTYMDPKQPDEFAVRGRARAVERDRRDELAADWPWTVGADVRAFELLLDEAVLGERGADEWPPRYSTWTERPQDR